MLDPRYKDKYGVTESEMEEALAFEALSSQADAVRDFYNGYDTADPKLRLYNPWSALNLLAKKRIVPYWIETGRVDFIAKAMWSAPMEVRESLNSLLNGGTMTFPVQVDLDLKSLKSLKVLWNLLLLAGYLTGRRTGASRDEIEARVPNGEVSHELSSMWSRVFSQLAVKGQYNNCLRALSKGIRLRWNESFGRSFCAW